MRSLLPSCLIILIACGPSFHQAPPDIGGYPDRLAVKRWTDLFRETAPLDPALPAAEALDATCAALPETLRPLDTGRRLAEIDKLLSENRLGPYRAARANFLHELRELAVDPAAFDNAAPYLAWRTSENSALPAPPPSPKPWHMEDAEYQELQDAYHHTLARRTDTLAAEIERSSPQLVPYWLTRLGAFYFETSRHLEASRTFASVVEKFPGHPRAEAARLMQARSLLEHARRLRREDRLKPLDELGLREENPDIQVTLATAEELLLRFIQNHPKGRFTPDAHGWLAAAAFDRGLYGTAVKYQLERLSLQPTREITRSVLRECDFIFELLLATSAGDNADPWIDPERDFDAASVARHPVVTRLFLQHTLDPAGNLTLGDIERLTGEPQARDRRPPGILGNRIFRPQHFIRAALDALSQEILKINGIDDPVILHLLAWSSSENGEHPQALALLQRIPEAAATSDEALYAKAVILQRAARHQEAAAAFRDLKSRHPGSPLLADQPFRLALSLAKSGHPGTAIATLAPFQTHEDEPAGDPLRPSLELVQWADTLLQFSPLAELASDLSQLPPGHPATPVIREAVRARAIAGRDFALAEKHLSPGPPPAPPEWEYPRDRALRAMTMDHELWQQRAAPLSALYQKLSSAPEKDRAAIHLDIARHWMNHRGQLTLPSLLLFYYANSEEEKQDLLRRKNALHLGHDPAFIDTELDRRDEATHALHHAGEAGKSDDPAIAAPALELANHALFRRAEFSLYQRSRVLEADASAISLDLHRQLLLRFPGSAEAKRSVSYSFQPAIGPWMPGDYNTSNSAEAILTAITGAPANRWLEDDDEAAVAAKKIHQLPARFLDLNPATPLPVIRRDLNSAIRELQQLRKKTANLHQDSIIAVVDRLDDLHSAASLPDITTSGFIAYASGNKQLPPAFASLLSYRARLTPRQENAGPSNDTITGWQEFLATYPDSPKAEAASFRLTRLFARQFRGRVQVAAFRFPDAPVINGYKHISVARPDPADDPEAVLAAIAEHEARFPAARYQDDLNLLRAGALIDQEKFDEALVLLTSLLSNPVQADLHTLAALNFCDIAQRLLDPSTRGPVLSAFRQNPRALSLLKSLIHGDTFLSRLGPMNLD